MLVDRVLRSLDYEHEYYSAWSVERGIFFAFALGLVVGAICAVVVIHAG